MVWLLMARAFRGLSGPGSLPRTKAEALLASGEWNCNPCAMHRVILQAAALWVTATHLPAAPALEAGGASPTPGSIEVVTKDAPPALLETVAE